MKKLAIIACAVWATQALAQPAPQTQVAQTTWPATLRLHLLSEPCGWPGGAMRAQQIRPDRTVVWGCWGYNESGVQILWDTGRTEQVDYLHLWAPSSKGMWQQMGYQTLHQRVWFLRNNQ